MADSNVFSSPFGPQPYGGPGGGGVTASYTFAMLPATYAVGQPVWVSDIGRAIIGASPVAATGSLWAFNGTRWAPVGGQVLLAQLDTAVAGLTNSEVVSGQLLLPAGFLKAFDRIRFRIGLTKSGTTDSAAPRLRAGTAGTTGDAGVVTNTALPASQVHGSVEYDIKILTATTWQITSRSDLGVGGGTTNAIPSAATVANISNALYLGVGATSSGASNTVGISDAQIWLIR